MKEKNNRFFLGGDSKISHQEISLFGFSVAGLSFLLADTALLQDLIQLRNKITCNISFVVAFA